MNRVEKLKKAWARPDRRPIWQIAYLLPLYPIYLLARGFVDWMDEQ